MSFEVGEHFRFGDEGDVLEELELGEASIVAYRFSALARRPASSACLMEVVRSFVLLSVPSGQKSDSRRHKEPSSAVVHAKALVLDGRMRLSLPLARLLIASQPVAMDGVDGFARWR